MGLSFEIASTRESVGNVLEDFLSFSNLGPQLSMRTARRVCCLSISKIPLLPLEKMDGTYRLLGIWSVDFRKQNGALIAGNFCNALDVDISLA